MNENLFTDARSVERKDDLLQVNYNTLEVARRIWIEHLKPRIKLLAIGGVAMVFAALTTGAVPFLIQTAADEIFINRNEQMVLAVALGVVVVTLVKAFAEYVSNITIGFLGHRFIADLRIRMFECLAYADLSWIERVHSGLFVSGFLNDATLIRQTSSRIIVGLGENLLKVIVLAGTMFWMDPQLASLILICMPIGIFLLGRQRRKMHKSTTKSLQETGDLSALLSQTLRGVRIVKAYGREKQEISRATNVINRALEFTMRGARARARSSPMVEVLTGLGFALAIYYAGVKGLSGEVSLGHFIGFMAAAMLIYQPLKSVATLQTSLQEGVAAASRVFGIIDHQVHLTEDENAPPLKVGKGEICFEEVDFSYDSSVPVLNRFSFKVPAGKTVALVGPSGAGKSTILNLVLRFFDPSSGRVLIDGQDISKVTIDSLRRSLALVTQEPILFDDPIGVNIAYGSEGENEAAIIAAAKAAAAHDFITEYASGYQTAVGEAGVALSGGERQRVAIARAILKDAPILLLDEPTSSLDSQAEAKVSHALERLMKGRTVLMIAHRLSTVKRADFICVLDQGHVVETGTHRELIAKGGLYSTLHKTQLEAGSLEND